MSIEFIALHNKPVFKEDTGQLLDNAEAPALYRGAKIITLASYPKKTVIPEENEVVAQPKTTGWVNQLVNRCSNLFSFKK